jgi:hypothetical protein
MQESSGRRLIEPAESVGGWTPAGTTQEITGKGLGARQAAICIARFGAQPKHEQKRKECGSEQPNEGWPRDRREHGPYGDRRNARQPRRALALGARPSRPCAP